MPQIGIFCSLLLFVGHVDQKIEPVTLGIAFDDRAELLFVELQEFLNGSPERI